MEEINIFWEGSISLEDIENGKIGNNKSQDYGIYQIYGSHPIYEHDVLLYIGKASRQTFKKRINQEGHWWNNQGADNVKIYFGRLIGNTPTEEEWDEMIFKAENLLIYTHRPAHNSSNINSINQERLKNTHILNWGTFRSLLPEVTSVKIFNETKENSDDYFTMENIYL